MQFEHSRDRECRRGHILYGKTFTNPHTIWWFVLQFLVVDISFSLDLAGRQVGAIVTCANRIQRGEFLLLIPSLYSMYYFSEQLIPVVIVWFVFY